MPQPDTADTRLMAGSDPATALALLSRIPIKARFERGARAAWAYPLAGAAVAIWAIILAAGAWALGAHPWALALGVMGAMILATGAMHEDGLADCADGFWGGWERTRRLDIMKDSAIGTYGVLALLLVLAAEFAALSALFTGAFWPAAGMILAAAMLSRAGMVLGMAAMKHARDTGLAHQTGRPTPRTAALATVIALMASALTAGLGTTVILAFVTCVLAATLALLAHRKIGGQTGDVLGMIQKTSYVAMVVVAAHLI